MTRYSLINIYEFRDNGRVSGTWIQDHHGDDESALQWAQETHNTNSNAIDLAVVLASNSHGNQVFNVTPIHLLRRKS